MNIEEFISKEFNRFSIKNSGCLKEYLQTLADEFHEDSSKLEHVSSLVHDKKIDPSLFVRSPMNVTKKYNDSHKNGAELIYFLSFYSDITHQLSNIYLDLSRKTEINVASLILKKLALTKKIQEGMMIALKTKFIVA